MNCPRALLCLAVLGLVCGCITAPPKLPGPTAQKSNLTPGMVKRTIDKGVTGQTKILQTFGAPNIVSRDTAGSEVWTYDVQSVAHTSAQTSASGGMGAAAGGVAGSVPIVGGAGGGGKRSTSTGMVSSSTFTLMITFDENDVVSDYRMQSTSF